MYTWRVLSALQYYSLEEESSTASRLDAGDISQCLHSRKRIWKLTCEIIPKTVEEVASCENRKQDFFVSVQHTWHCLTDRMSGWGRWKQSNSDSSCCLRTQVSSTLQRPQFSPTHYLSVRSSRSATLSKQIFLLTPHSWCFLTKKTKAIASLRKGSVLCPYSQARRLIPGSTVFNNPLLLPLSVQIYVI
jgi:hypothetical protein